MIEDGHGNERGFCSGSSQRTGVVDHQNLNLLQSSQRSGGVEKSLMETEGRSFSDFYRNSSEEIFLNTLMESSIGIPAPTMETLGFKNLSQPFRADSEELFNSWLMNGEANGSITHRRQASRRISTELAALSHHNNGGTFQNRHGNSNLMQQNVGAPEDSTDSQHLLRSVVEKGVEASNVYLAKAWFQSSQPMTRSRSSELRKRYAAMQNFQMPTGMNLAHNTSTRDTISTKQEFTTMSGFSNISMGEMPNQLGSFMSPSNSSSSPFDAPPMAPVDAVSSVVSMLKGTLERKKLSNHTDKDISNGCSFAFYGRQDIMAGNQGGVSQMPELLGAFQGLTPGQMKASRNLQTVDESVEIDIEDFIAPSNPIQMTTVSQEPSQSESSAAAPVLSTGFDACDGPSSSAQALSICESSRNHISNGSSEHDAKAKEIRERMFENNIKNDRKKGSLVRMGSVTSGGSVDKADPTKKRRVERSRKMAEAKERNMTPVIPSDMQAILKRCENLEKEVRSLKLNLSFMNRKDSEQTKQIEELQKQNEELADEKERLLEEIERILSESGKM